jgi:intraflagellar transport protein 74
MSPRRSFIGEYEAKNRQFANEIDRMFLQIKQEESALQTIEQQIEQVYQRNQSKIDSMEPTKVQQYRELVQQNLSLMEQRAQMQGHVDSVSDQIALIKGQREANSYNAEYRDLEEKAFRLQKLLQSLDEEHQISQMDPAEMQKSMLAKVKADNAHSTELDERIKQLREDKRKAEQTLADLQSEWSGRESGAKGEDK